MNLKILNKEVGEIVRSHEGVSRVSASSSGAINIDFHEPGRAGETWASMAGKMIEVLDEDVDGHFEQLADVATDGDRAAGHTCAHPEWRGVTAAIEGRGSGTTWVVEECERCGIYRLNDDPTFVGEVV